MCEWLSSGEWSDVQLQCGGRSFAAHRAVLASASAFLRRILLSCSTEDSPTFIVLPDFDLDAMSSVLYYIYNGEVVIQKHKVEMFMEIIKAMQIFIDEQYLPNACKNIETVSLCYKADHQENNKIFCLGDGSDEALVNLRKGFLSSDSYTTRKSYDDSHFRDQQITQRDWDEHALRNTESACRDRQRSFLRDLFIETYPRNGNTNGRVASVLAIQSARYHAPASVLLTNANGKHLRVEDTHEIYRKSTDIPEYLTNGTPSLRNSHIKDRSGLFWSYELSRFKKNNSTMSRFNSTLSNSKDEINKQLLDHLSIYQSQTGLLELQTGNPSFDHGRIEYHQNHKLFSESSLIHDNHIQEKKIFTNNAKVNLNMINSETSFSNSTCNIFSKSAVLNEVLDSPWRPRQPNNYKPFRRKLQDTSSSNSLENIKECKENDSNNNIKKLSVPEAIERLSANGSSIERPLSISEIDIVNDFKCANCDQVFMNKEALSIHARLHSSPARYSCTECSKSFSQLRNFKYHMSVHRGTREFAATCTVCGKYFNDRGYLSSHMKIHRNRKEYKCSQCPKSFNQRVAYNMHVRIHTGVKPHVCNECGKAFSRKMLLKQHQRTHSGERPYACPHCDKRFADRSNMTLHLRLHTGVKPFSCTMCPKSFTKKHHLKSHLNFHTGAKPYSCPKCKLAFTQSSNMRTHLKKCTAPELTENAETHTSS